MMLMLQLREIFSRQQEAFEHFFSSVDLELGHRVLEHLFSCRGDLHFTGVGKSGFIAKKLAKTFCATGSRAHYLDPIGALHGDFGLVHAHDLVVILSKSAKSTELIPLIALLKKQKIDFMLWSSNSDTRIEGALITQHLPLKGEVCPFKKAPLTSSALQLVFGNCMAAALCQKKEFDLESYSINHSGGSIGKSLRRVNEYMVTGDALPIASADETLEKKLVELSKKKLGTLLIVKDMSLIGVFTDGDLRRAIQKHGSEFLHMPLKNLMTKNPKTIESGSLVKEAVSLMHLGDNKIMALPVMSQEKLVGLVHLHQIS
jgi:arabinose-5-phosphate isomerase